MMTRRTAAKSGLGALVASLVGGQSTANASSPKITFEITKTPEEWKKILDIDNAQEAASRYIASAVREKMGSDPGIVDASINERPPHY